MEGVKLNDLQRYAPLYKTLHRMTQLEYRKLWKLCFGLSYKVKDDIEYLFELFFKR